MPPSSIQNLATEVWGPRAEKAWAMLVGAASGLREEGPTRDPEGFVRAVAQLAPWHLYTGDGASDALLSAALPLARERGLPELPSLVLTLAGRAAQRGDFANASSWLMSARAAGGDGAAADLLDIHLAIRVGDLERARELLGERALEEPGMRIQHAFWLLAAGAFDDAEALLEEVDRSTQSGAIRRGASAFFMAESAVRRGAWERALQQIERAREGLGFLGQTVASRALEVWEARALRQLGRPDLALVRARRVFDGAVRAGLGEAMVESAIELVELSRGEERARWLSSLRSLRPATSRPEVARRVDAWLGDATRVAGVEVDADGRWLRGAEGRVDLESRPVLRRLVRALARATGPLDVDALFEAGWPGERVRAQSRGPRVYTAVWQLRRLGLGEHLARTEAGYALDARVR